MGQRSFWENKRKDKKMAILKLKPACKDYLWGGNRLKTDFNKEYDGEILAETWELSCHKDGPSVIVNGRDAGKTFTEYIKENGNKAAGTNCGRFEDFPILIKFIDARDNLSIQVHPDNEYALKNEGQYGKTETWYIVDAKEGAGIYYGVKEAMSKEEFGAKIADNTVLDALNFQKVKKGEMYFIESGTIHAIGKDVLIAEIQQNSNVTYRVYDFGRVGADGKPRELHIEKAKDVTNLTPMKEKKEFGAHLADCDYFTVDGLHVNGACDGATDGTTFHSILILDGEGILTSGEESVSFRKGDSLFVPADNGAYKIEGKADALLTTVRAER